MKCFDDAKQMTALSDFCALYSWGIHRRKQWSKQSGRRVYSSSCGEGWVGEQTKHELCYKLRTLIKIIDGYWFIDCNRCTTLVQDVSKRIIPHHYTGRQVSSTETHTAVELVGNMIPTGTRHLLANSWPITCYPRLPCSPRRGWVLFWPGWLISTLSNRTSALIFSSNSES